MSGESVSAAEVGPILTAIGGLTASVQNLEKGQAAAVQAAREDFKGVYERIEKLALEQRGQMSALYQNGCGKAAVHDAACGDHEKRLRGLETWQTGHEAEARLVAHDAGAVAGTAAGSGAGRASGALWGGGIAAGVTAAVAVLKALAAAFMGHGGPQP